MATVEATRALTLRKLHGSVVAKCRQCNSWATMQVETEQGITNACATHVQLAVNHYLKAHGIR